MGRIGYFPSKYVTKLHPGERPLQVTHNLQVTDGAENGLKLLRDQVRYSMITRTKLPCKNSLIVNYSEIFIECSLKLRMNECTNAECTNMNT